ncbi:hypothetical protein [Paraliobacillus ryukyuensis]|uniref:hypothetical protein n=1 Tax=Paraliobacillus ryukyuensis TaxID=200904 RepID=UPI0009A63D2E|nr:hypothetical protein [Paraliobacillus ryukyuensis]
MDGRNYIVSWNARGMDFNYNGYINIWDADRESAKEKAITLVSRDMLISRNLITVTNVSIQ